MKNIPLIAAQRFRVGTVLVSNDAEQVYIRYRVDAMPGCLLHDLCAHLAVEGGPSAEGGIPRDEQGLLPGRFALRASTTGTVDHTFTAPIQDAWRRSGVVWIAAYATAGDSLHPVRVVSAQQGPKRNGQPVAADRADPGKALAPKCPADWTPGQPVTFYTLGAGGVITVDFGRSLEAAQFARITCWEITAGQKMFEKLKVELAEDPTGPWALLPQEASNQRPQVGTLITAANVPIVGVQRYRYARLTDTSGLVIDPSIGPNCWEDGFDLDGVGAQAPDREDAWALAGEQVSQAAGWGRAFAYPLE